MIAFSTKPKEKGCYHLRKKANQMEKSVSWGPPCLVHWEITHEQTHTRWGHMLAILSGLSSVYITYEFWHAAFPRVTKSAVFCVSTAIAHIPTWPHQAFVEVQASKTTYTQPCKFSQTVFFSSNLIFFLALPPAHLLMLIWFSSFLSFFSAL